LLRNHRGGKLSIIIISNDGGSRVVHLEWRPRHERQDVAPARDRRPQARDTLRRSKRKPSKKQHSTEKTATAHQNIQLPNDYVSTGGERNTQSLALGSIPAMHYKSGMFLPSAGLHRGGRLSIITRCAEFYPILYTRVGRPSSESDNACLWRMFFLTLDYQNIMFRARVPKWLNLCVIGCSSCAHSFHLCRRKGTAADCMCMPTAADHTRTCTRRRKGTSGNMLVHGGTHPGCMAASSTNRVTRASAC
jgi:hypothetical protein